jgi:hypothetical protein
LKGMKRFVGLTIAVIVLTTLVAGDLIFSQPSPKPNSITIEPQSIGICVHTLSAKDAQLVNRSGAKWIRIDATNNLTDFNASLHNAKAYNLSVLAILDSWMFNNSSIFTLDAWRSNVTFYVSTYADYVDAWEIWNEPANPTYPLLNLELNMSKPNYQGNLVAIVGFYFSMAQSAYPIIRQHDPTATILLFGGLNLYSGNVSNLQIDEEFASLLAARNIQQYGDAISIHAYPWGPINTQVWQIYNSSLANYCELFTNKSLDLWVTETGQPFINNSEIKIDETAQARYLSEVILFFEVNATKTFWYSLHDNQWEQNADNAQGFGLIEDNGTPRPGYNALEKLLGH